MNFCSSCGANVSLRVPNGDNLPRYICDSCETIHYSNPKIVAGCIGEWDGKILLCKRAIEPRLGLWTLPAGFMENNETVQQAAARETQEEACAKVVDTSLYGVFNLPHISQVYMIYRGIVAEGKAEPGQESLEVAFVTEQEIPWDNMAFPVMTECLKRYLADRKEGHYPVRISDVIRRADQSIDVIRY